MAYQRISFRTPWMLVPVFIILACGIGAAGLLFYLEQKQGITREKRNELLAVAELKARTIAEWRTAHLEDAGVILDNPLLLPLVDRLLRAGADRSSAEREIRRWMASRQRHYRYERFILLDPEGTPLISVPDSRHFQLTRFRRNLFREAGRTGRATSSDIYRESAAGAVCFETFIPLRSVVPGSKRRPAVMLVRLDLRRTLFPMLSTWPNSTDSAETLLVRREGDSVVYLNRPGGPDAGAVLPRRSLSDPRMVAAAVRGRQGIVEGLDYRGIPVIAAVKGIPGSGWFLEVKVDAEEVYAPIRERARLLGGLAAVLILAAGVCCYLLWRQARLGFYRELYETERDHMAAVQRSERELQSKRLELESLNRSLEQRVRQELERNREKDHILIQQGRLAAMGEMIGNIAHQWRQPLNVVGLLVQSLPEYSRNGELTEECLEDTARHAMEVIGYMSRTMNDFRNFFRPDKEKTDFALREVVERSISFIQPHFHYHDIEVTLRIAEGLTANGYPNEYSQVLLNILGNAKDIFLERGTSKPAITIRAYEERGRTVVSVADNAGGVPEDILARIFDPYFTCKRSGEGTGLGLYISKTIIEKNMNGSLTARNNGSGAEFLIEV